MLIEKTADPSDHSWKCFPTDLRLTCFAADVGLDGVLHQLAPALQGQLLFNVSLVGFDGFDAEVQFLGDLARAAAFADQTEDLELAIG